MQTEYLGVVLEWADITDVGRVRTLNEDSLLAAPPVFAVADGMGGHDAGEVASALVISRLSALQGDEPPDVDQIAREFREINDLLLAATVDGRNVDMGTTAVALIIASHNDVLSWLIVNVGDSRAYCAAGGECHQVTSDHSYVQELVDAGEITPVEARKHPDRNVVTQALGVADVVHPDFWVRPFRVGERFLLCSDGLSGEVEDTEICELVLSGQSPQAVAEQLTAKALAAGGRDNVSIVVVDVIEIPSEVSVSTETKPKRGGERQKNDDLNEVTNEAAPGERKINPSGLPAQRTIEKVPFETVSLDTVALPAVEVTPANLIVQAPVSEYELAELARDEILEPTVVGPMIGPPPPAAPSGLDRATKGADERER